MINSCKKCGRLMGKKIHECPEHAWNRGVPHSKETREKIRKILTGRKSPMQIGNKHGLGYRHTPEAIEKIRQAKMGNKYTLGRKRPIEERRMMSELRRGEKCYLWKGGKTSEANLARSSLEYRLWKEAVLKRDNYICQGDGCEKQSLPGRFILMHADHIKPFSLFPELRFAIDNGRTLCVPCHQKTPTYSFRVRELTRNDFV